LAAQLVNYGEEVYTAAGEQLTYTLCVLWVSGWVEWGGVGGGYTVTATPSENSTTLLRAALQDWENGWRLSLGLAAVPALILTLGGICLPESPNSLIERGRRQQGRAVLQRIRGCDDVSAEFEDMCEVSEMGLATSRVTPGSQTAWVWPDLESILLP
jgi:hypothetical protein